MLPRLMTLWQRVPFRHMTALVVALFVIREQFPFSHFPMYAGSSEEADVLFITDQNDQPLAMKRVFKAGGSAALKKTWKSEIATLARPQGRSIEQATAAEREQAARVVLADLTQRVRRSELPAGVQSLRLYVRLFTLREGAGLAEEPPQRLAEQSL